MDYVVQLNDDENTIEMKSNILNAIKELQNLYSWNQFYQERNLRNNMRVAQAQITQKKRKINELKMLFRKK